MEAVKMWNQTRPLCLPIELCQQEKPSKLLDMKRGKNMKLIITFKLNFIDRKDLFKTWNVQS